MKARYLLMMLLGLTMLEAVRQPEPTKAEPLPDILDDTGYVPNEIQTKVPGISRDEAREIAYTLLTAWKRNHLDRMPTLTEIHCLIVDGIREAKLITGAA